LPDRRSLALVSAIGLVLVLALAGPAAAKRVRVFAVGPKLDLTWVDTRTHYHDKLFALFDRARRTPGAPAIQRGADDVASHLLGPTDRARPVATARDLVTLPEDIGLMSVFTGSKGAAARRASSITESIAAVLAGYAPEVAFYAARHPALALRNPPTRLLALALTDVFGRVAVETFAELADRYDVYLEAGVNMAQSWRVVCVSRATFQTLPGGVECDEENPLRVAQLRSADEPTRTYAYEATTDRPSNMALLFDPDGRLIAKQVKAYLTPTELPGQLDLTPGSVSGLSRVDTPVGRLGFVTSRDAFSPDVVQKLDQQHVEVLIQPEFFVNDVVRAQGMWAPDTLKSSGFSAMLRYPSIGALVQPEMTGNIFEFSADAQQYIAIKPRSVRKAPRGWLVGQPPAPGLANVDRWVVPDPVGPDEPFDARRRRLGAAGSRLSRDGPPCPVPDEAGPCRGGQVENVLFHDLDVDATPRYRRRAARRRGRSPFTLNKPLAAARHPQRNVALAARGRRAWAAFEERRGGRDQVFLARSRDHGAHWSKRRVRPTGRPAGTADEWWPSVAVGPDGRVWISWQDDSTGTHRVYFASSSDGGRRFSAPRAVDPASPRSLQWKPSIAAGAAGGAVVAWVDERTRFATEPHLPQAGVWFARLRPDGPDRAERLDQVRQGGAEAALDNAWSPSVAARGGKVLVAYMDFVTADWRIYSRESSDGGATFGGPEKVNDTPPVKTDPILPPENEALDDWPAAAIGDRPVVAFTDFRKHDASTRPHELYDTLVTVPGARNRQVDHHGADQVSTFSPALLALPGGDALVAWQDMAAGPGDIMIVRMRDGLERGRAVRVDDSGTAGWNQWRPALALTGRRVVAAWEDERDGPPQIYTARARPARIR
jgi:hypothetical protein